MIDISLPGLRNQAKRWIANRGWSAVVGELIQNAMDEASTSIEITLRPIHGRPMVELIVRDDNPEGFEDLRDAYTLFADSKKGPDATKAGRFNAGEKYVIALARWSSIASTTKTIEFDWDTGRHERRAKTERGTVFTGHFPMTRTEMGDVEDYIRTVLPRPGVRIVFNGTLLSTRTPILSFEETLETELAAAFGEPLRRTQRKSIIEVHEVLPGEEATLYELGLPVVATGDKYHINVLQRVPLNVERDNVRPAYLRHIRTVVANRTAHLLEQQDAGQTWLAEALADPRIEPEAAKNILVNMFGEDFVSRDPSDPESAKKAVSNGFSVIEPRHLSKEAWRNIRRHGLVESAGKRFPTQRIESSRDGEPAIPRSLWTQAMCIIEEYARSLASELIGVHVEVEYYQKMTFQGGYGRAEKRLLLDRCVERYSIQEIDALLIHEFGHEYESDHLSEKYYAALCKLGASMKEQALKEPGLFLRFEEDLEAARSDSALRAGEAR